MKLAGKLQVWNLTDDPKRGRRYIALNTNFKLLKRYVKINVYDPFADTGEQRVAKARHLTKIKSAYSNEDYTPTAFNLGVSDISSFNIDDKENVTIPLSEDNKLVLLDGGTRFRALSKFQEECQGNSTARRIDDLPIPIIVYLDPEKRSDDFINLQLGEPVNKSHLQSLRIRTGRLSDAKLALLKPAHELAVYLHKDLLSPFHNKITFGQDEPENPSLQFSQIATDHKGSMIGSLYGTAKLLTVMKKDMSWFSSVFSDLYEIIQEDTKAADKGNLLSLPPNGPKGCAANIISVVNTVIYYLYLRYQMSDQWETIEDHKTHLLECLRVYEHPVNKDVSRQRRINLSCIFAQSLYYPMESDDSCPTGFHMGIPYTLAVQVGFSCFGLEPPSPEDAKLGNDEVDVRAEEIDSVTIPSDTDEEFND